MVYTKKSPEALAGVGESLHQKSAFFPFLSSALLCISSPSGPQQLPSYSFQDQVHGQEHPSLKSPSKPTVAPIGSAQVTWCPMSQSLCLEEQDSLIGQAWSQGWLSCSPPPPLLTKWAEMYAGKSGFSDWTAVSGFLLSPGL